MVDGAESPGWSESISGISGGISALSDSRGKTLEAVESLRALRGAERR